jgi:NADPH:quinone reductase-like Zn-dependent oxidoreductase
MPSVVVEAVGPDVTDISVGDRVGYLWGRRARIQKRA